MARQPALRRYRAPTGAALARANSDRGFTLVEVMAAMVVFVIISTATVSILIQGLRTIRENSDRVMAANVARSQLDYWRAQGANKIPEGLTKGVQGDLGGVVDTNFTVTMNATWVPLGQNTTSCVAAVPGAYKRVTVTAQSKNMSAPQVLDTVVYVDNTDVNKQTGVVRVRIKDQFGVAVSDVVVTGTDTGAPTNNFTLTTGSDGCLYLPGKAPTSTLKITISRSGYVSPPSSGTTQTVQVIAAQLANADFLYAASSRLQFTSGMSTYPYPPAIPVTWQFNDIGSTTNATTAGSTVSDLWPSTGGMKATTLCTAPWITAGFTAGQSTLVTMPASKVLVRGLPANTTVSGKCGASTVVLGKTDSIGQLKVGVPYGVWTFSASGQSETQGQVLVASESVITVAFTVANLDGLNPSPTPTPTPTPTP